MKNRQIRLSPLFTGSTALAWFVLGVAAAFVLALGSGDEMSVRIWRTGGITLARDGRSMNRVDGNACMKLCSESHSSDCREVCSLDYISAVPDSQLPKQHRRGIYKRAHRYGDLSALRADRGPWDPSWDNSIAICALMYLENTTDVREWLLYHRYLPIIMCMVAAVAMILSDCASGVTVMVVCLTHADLVW